MIEHENLSIEEALSAIREMLQTSERYQAKMTVGTSQHSLLTHRIAMLKVATTMLSCACSETEFLRVSSRQELLDAMTPLESLIGKMEKSFTRISQSSWQSRRLASSLQALCLFRDMACQTLELPPHDA